MPAPSPTNSITNLPVKIEIQVNGNNIKDTYQIKSIQVVHAINKISYAEVVLLGDALTEGMAIADDGDLVPGNTISISAGYGAATTIFNGVIVSNAVEIDTTSSSFKIVCRHRAATMTYNKNEAEFFNTTDSTIITTIANNYGLSIKVDEVAMKQEAVFQRMATDWDFILTRCNCNGFIVCMDDNNTVTISKPQLSSNPVLRLSFGESILSFDAELSAENQPTTLTASAWDTKMQALINADAAEPLVNAQGNISAKKLSGTLSQQPLTLITAAPLAKDDLKTWASAALLFKRLSAFKGNVKFVGNATVKTGNIIELAGVGKTFEGNAFVSAVNHVLEDGAWNTTVKFGLNYVPPYNRTDFSYPPAAGQMPAVYGLQIATVKKISADPTSLYRVLINIASNAKTQTGTWARMANFYATTNAGSVFMPEVGDEVVAGFLEGDSRYPVILGSLYSDKNQSPNPAKDENNYIKSITTKSNMILSFDDEHKIISIKTPGGNSITISDKDKGITVADQNSNAVKLSPDGIIVNSSKDIQLTASGNITLSATQKITIAAQQDVAVSGMNVTNTAQVGFTGKGSTTAELSASGQTTVKGAIVMIN